jgi:hypothetical protein
VYEQHGSRESGIKTGSKNDRTHCLESTAWTVSALVCGRRYSGQGCPDAVRQSGVTIVENGGR